MSTEIFNVEKYTQYLKDHMQNGHLVSGGTHINCRCPECGDSRDPRHAHMYISIPNVEQMTPSLYYCHKCSTRGMVSYKKFIEWNIYDPEIVAQLEAYNKLIRGTASNYKYFDSTIFPLVQMNTTVNDNSYRKLAYINNRLGTNLSFEDLRRLKICLNLFDLIIDNRITNLTRNQNIIEQLSREFIGFISVDNAFVNMRRTCEEGIVYKGIDKRYINYVLHDKFDNSKKFYSVPTVVNLNSTHRTKIHIAEGPFDILSVYLNCRNREPGIYSSVTGNNFIPILMYFLVELAIPYAELHLYPDNDKFGTDNRLMYMVNTIPDVNIPVYVHRNVVPGQKDFGVDKSLINEKISILRGDIYG